MQVGKCSPSVPFYQLIAIDWNSLQIVGSTSQQNLNSHGSLCLFWFVCRSYKSFSMASSTAFLASAYVNTLQRYDASHEFEMESAEGKKKYEWDGILKKLKDTLLPQLEKAKNLGTLCIFCKGSKEN